MNWDFAMDRAEREATLADLLSALNSAVAAGCPMGAKVRVALVSGGNPRMRTVDAASSVPLAGVSPPTESGQGDVLLLVENAPVSVQIVIP